MYHLMLFNKNSTPLKLSVNSFIVPYNPSIHENNRYKSLLATDRHPRKLFIFIFDERWVHPGPPVFRCTIFFFDR